MKAMQDIKNKGKSRLQNFNQKLDHVREAERKSGQDKKANVKKEKAETEIKDLDKVLD